MFWNQANLGLFFHEKSFVQVEIIDFAKEKHWVTQFSEKGICCHKFFFWKEQIVKLRPKTAVLWEGVITFPSTHYIFKSSLEKTCQLNAILPKDAPSGRNWEEKSCTVYERLETFCHHPQSGFCAKKTCIPMFGNPRWFPPSQGPMNYEFNLDS